MARVSTIAEAIEPYDKCWGVGASGFAKDPSPFERINLILDDTPKTTNGEIFADRAVIFTETMKEMEGKPMVLQMAAAMKAFLSKGKVHLFDHELIVGSMLCPKKGAPVFPEFGIDWIVKEIEDGTLDYCETHTHDYFTNSEECYKQLKEIQPFWKGKQCEDYVVPMLTEDQIKGSHMGHGVYFSGSYLTCGAGHTGVNYDRILHMGYGAIRKEIEEKKAALDLSKPDDIEKDVFYQAELLVNEGITIMIRRHADALREKAETTEDETRKKELLQMADNCDWISTEAPRTFWEAIQAVEFANMVVLLESNGHSISYGRFDQYMLPFYENDLKTGAATREFMQELIENFYIKIWEKNKVRTSPSVEVFGNGGIGGPGLTVGGISADGNDGRVQLRSLSSCIQ